MSIQLYCTLHSPFSTHIQQLDKTINTHNLVRFQPTSMRYGIVNYSAQVFSYDILYLGTHTDTHARTQLQTNTKTQPIPTMPNQSAVRCGHEPIQFNMILRTTITGELWCLYCEDLGENLPARWASASLSTTSNVSSGKLAVMCTCDYVNLYFVIFECTLLEMNVLLQQLTAL